MLVDQVLHRPLKHLESITLCLLIDLRASYDAPATPTIPGILGEATPPCADHYSSYDDEVERGDGETQDVTGRGRVAII
jgi:hypothetical protein